MAKACRLAEDKIPVVNPTPCLLCMNTGMLLPSEEETMKGELLKERELEVGGLVVFLFFFFSLFPTVSTRRPRPDIFRPERQGTHGPPGLRLDYLRFWRFQTAGNRAVQYWQRLAARQLATH
jgi:hypothetical protein